MRHDFNKCGGRSLVAGHENFSLRLLLWRKKALDPVQRGIHIRIVYETAQFKRWQLHQERQFERPHFAFSAVSDEDIFMAGANSNLLSVISDRLYV